MNKKVIAASATITLITAATVWFNGREVPVKTAETQCASFCSIHKNHKLIPTGKKVGGKDHVECWCEVEGRGWKHNRTDMNLTK